jgi:hypothetical protein
MGRTRRVAGVIALRGVRAGGWPVLNPEVFVEPRWWSRLVRPTTDLGVVLQVASLLAVLALSWWVARTRTEWRLVIAGIGLVLLGTIGLRAAH